MKTEEEIKEKIKEFKEELKFYKSKYFKNQNVQDRINRIEIRIDELKWVLKK